MFDVVFASSLGVTEPRLQPTSPCETSQGDVYQVYSASAVHVQDSASGLRKFMNEFDLEDGDLSCDFLPAHPVAYTHPMAATICSKECAESLLQDLTKTGNIPHLRALKPGCIWLCISMTFDDFVSR